MPYRLYPMLGRRGAVLALMGLIYAVVGLAYMSMPLSPTQEDTMRVLLLLAPLPVWGVAWFAAGLLALVCAALCRRMPAADRWGYTALVGLAVAWCAGYAGAAIGFAVERAALGVAVWAALAGMLLIIAGWPEPGATER